MSRDGNGHPQHMLRAVMGDGQVLTCCGRIVPEEWATTDCVDVTCDATGCFAAAEERFKRRLKAQEAWSTPPLCKRCGKRVVTQNRHGHWASHGECKTCHAKNGCEIGDCDRPARGFIQDTPACEMHITRLRRGLPLHAPPLRRWHG